MLGKSQASHKVKLCINWNVKFSLLWTVQKFLKGKVRFPGKVSWDVLLISVLASLFCLIYDTPLGGVLISLLLILCVPIKQVEIENFVWVFYKFLLKRKVFNLDLNLIICLINHFLEEKKYTRTAKAGGLNGLRSAKQRLEEFTGIEEGFN